MRVRILGLIALACALCCSSMAFSSTEGEDAIGLVLDSFHHAAAVADGKTYFDLLRDDAVFIGTDPTERWSIDQFRAFVEPYFSKGTGWLCCQMRVTEGAGVPASWFSLRTGGESGSTP